MSMGATIPEVRPEVVRRIAHWWQGEMDRHAAQGEAPSPPAMGEVQVRFSCTEEEALRGLVLGEHRHFSGTE